MSKVLSGILVAQRISSPDECTMRTLLRPAAIDGPHMTELWQHCDLITYRNTKGAKPKVSYQDHESKDQQIHTNTSNTYITLSKFMTVQGSVSFWQVVPRTTSLEWKKHERLSCSVLSFLMCPEFSKFPSSTSSTSLGSAFLASECPSPRAPNVCTPS